MNVESRSQGYAALRDVPFMPAFIGCTYGAVMDSQRSRSSKRRPAAKSRIAVAGASVLVSAGMVTGMLGAEAATDPAGATTVAAEAPASGQGLAFLLLPDGRVVAVQRVNPGAVAPGQTDSRPSLPMPRTHGSR
jgi:hypothetical protein